MLLDLDTEALLGRDVTVTVTLPAAGLAGPGRGLVRINFTVTRQHVKLEFPLSAVPDDADLDATITLAVAGAGGGGGGGGGAGKAFTSRTTVKSASCRRRPLRSSLHRAVPLDHVRVRACVRACV